MTAEQRKLEFAKERLNKELEHGKQLLEGLTERRFVLEERQLVGDITDRLRYEQAISDINIAIQSVEDKIKELLGKIEELNDRNFDDESSAEEALVDSDTGDLFTPEWRVLRSAVLYVDANLAYRFADATQDANIMLGFTTLFLGSTIGFGASLATSNTKNQRNIFGTSLIFTTILTIIFLILTVKFMRKSAEIKDKLFNEKQN